MDILRKALQRSWKKLFSSYDYVKGNIICSKMTKILGGDVAYPNLLHKNCNEICQPYVKQNPFDLVRFWSRR